MAEGRSESAEKRYKTSCEMISEPPFSIIWNSFKITAISSFQVLVFVLIYEASVEIYVSNFGPMNKIFGFGMQMDYGTYLLSILAGINTLAQIFLKKLIFRFTAAVLCAAVWISYWGNVADEVPNRFLLLSALGMLSFFSGVLLSYRDGDSFECIR